MSKQAFNQIAVLVREEIKLLLATPRPVNDYTGRPKPISGSYPSIQSNKIDTSLLYDSVDAAVYWQGSIDKVSLKNPPVLVVDFKSAGVDYAQYVQSGRKPGTPFKKTRTTRNGKVVEYTSFTSWPPITKIQEWVQSKPALSNPRLSLDTRTYLAGKSIAQYGIEPFPFVDMAIEKVFTELESRISQTYLEILQEYFTRTDIKIKIVV